MDGKVLATGTTRLQTSMTMLSTLSLPPFTNSKRRLSTTLSIVSPMCLQSLSTQRSRTSVRSSMRLSMWSSSYTDYHLSTYSKYTRFCLCPGNPLIKIRVNSYLSTTKWSIRVIYTMLKVWPIAYGCHHQSIKEAITKSASIKLPTEFI